MVVGQQMKEEGMIKINNGFYCVCFVSFYVFLFSLVFLCEFY